MQPPAAGFAGVSVGRPARRPGVRSPLPVDALALGRVQESLARPPASLVQGLQYIRPVRLFKAGGGVRRGDPLVKSLCAPDAFQYLLRHSLPRRKLDGELDPVAVLER